MAKVRFYYDVTIDEEEIMENLNYKDYSEINNNDIIERAKTLLSYDIQDRNINPSYLECEIIEKEEIYPDLEHDRLEEPEIL